MNKVQTAAYELIQADARFLYTLTQINRNAKNISSNFICMSQPYIGLFTDGAEQWCKKVGLKAPHFNTVEKKYYTLLRNSHKFFEKPYEEYLELLQEKFYESDNYFFSIRRLREKILGYYNVGTDVCGREFCGNTILCAAYIPISTLGNSEIGKWMIDISIIVGKLASFFKCTDFPVYKYDTDLTVKYEDYHLFKNSPLKMNTELGLLLFSILCSVNYVIEFIEHYFVDEIPQKLKFAYLQYYYLCEFIEDLNKHNETNFYLDKSMYNRSFRNCLAHYGLGQYMSESEIIKNDILKGLTNKAFNLDYRMAKESIYTNLKSLTRQIKEAILK